MNNYYAKQMRKHPFMVLFCWGSYALMFIGGALYFAIHDYQTVIGFVVSFFLITKARQLIEFLWTLIKRQSP